MSHSPGSLLIVGQGIAGTTLAWQCHFRGIPFRIIDDGHRSSSSLAAAGLFNPFILKRKKLAWNAAAFFDVLDPFYRQVESHLGSSCYHTIGVYRRAADVVELNDWQVLSDRPEFARFLGQQVRRLGTQGKGDTPGYQEVKEAGFLDVAAYLSASRIFFESLGQYEEKIIDIPMLKASRAEEERIVLARGVKEMRTWFKLDPFSPAKGHSMEISCPDLELHSIVSGPCFIIPLSNGNFRVGSTYSWDHFESGVEQVEIEKLKSSFSKMYDLPYEVIRSWAGVRPATRDRRPLIGALESHVDLFNGFGSRAVMTTPLLSSIYLASCFDGQPIPAEIDVSRFLDK